MKTTTQTRSGMAMRDGGENDKEHPTEIQQRGGNGEQLGARPDGDLAAHGVVDDRKLPVQCLRSPF